MVTYTKNKTANNHAVNNTIKSLNVAQTLTLKSSKIKTHVEKTENKNHVEKIKGEKI